jgi:hypothetical protein
VAAEGLFIIVRVGPGRQDESVPLFANRQLLGWGPRWPGADGEPAPNPPFLLPIKEHWASSSAQCRIEGFARKVTK